MPGAVRSDRTRPDPPDPRGRQRPMSTPSWSTAPLLQQFEFEMHYSGPVSGPLTLHLSNWAGNELRHRAGYGAGDSKMGTVISFRPELRTGRKSRLIASKPGSATVIILPVIRIERYTQGPACGTEPEPTSSPPRPRRRRAGRS